MIFTSAFSREFSRTRYNYNMKKNELEEMLESFGWIVEVLRIEYWMKYAVEGI